MKCDLSKKYYWWALLGLAGAVVFVLSNAFAYGQSVWFDEGYSILLARSSFSDLLALTAVDAHPPLYYLLLRVWGILFSFNEVILRSLSAFLMAGAVIMGLVLIRRLFSKKVALYVLPFLVLAPFLIRYGYEIRMYALATLIAISATYALVKARESIGKKWWIIYSVLVALGMYTLYMTVVVWLAHAIWQLVEFRKSKNVESKNGEGKLSFWRQAWVRAYIGAVVLFLPYMATFFWQLTHSALPGIGNEITLNQLVDSTSILLLYTPGYQLSGWASVAIVAVIFLIIWQWRGGWQKLPEKQRLYLRMLIFMVLVPLGFYALVSLPPSKPIFINRYLAHVSLFIYMFIGLLVALLVSRIKTKQDYHKNWPSVLAYVALLALVSVGLVRLNSAGNFVFERMQYPETQQLRSSIDCTDDTTIVADDPYTYIDSAYYFEGCDLRFYSEDEIDYRGGYAPLSSSSLRLAAPSDVSSVNLIRLSWEGQDPQFVVDDRYELMSTSVYDKQVVDVFRLKSANAE